MNDIKNKIGISAKIKLSKLIIEHPSGLPCCAKFCFQKDAWAICNPVACIFVANGAKVRKANVWSVLWSKSFSTSQNIGLFVEQNFVFYDCGGCLSKLPRCANAQKNCRAVKEMRLIKNFFEETMRNFSNDESGLCDENFN